MELLLLSALCLAAGSTIWTLLGANQTRFGSHTRLCPFVVPAHVMVQLALALLALVVALTVARDLLDVSHRSLRVLDWLALLAVFAAITIHIWDAAAGFPMLGYYVAGLALVGMLLVFRDLSPGRFVIWTGICELTGFVLIAALFGWVLRQFPHVVTALRVPGGSDRWYRNWFCTIQAVLATVAAALIVWIMLDTSFDGLGQGTALLGLSGRMTSCPAALMLLGATIVMAWQTRGRWRAGWQYASMAAGVLFTTSIGWARMDASIDISWSRRATYLMISTAMMTLLTGFGLARVLPGSGDWIQRARRAAYFFGGVALLLAAVAMIRRGML